MEPSQPPPQQSTDPPPTTQPQSHQQSSQPPPSSPLPPPSSTLPSVSTPTIPSSSNPNPSPATSIAPQHQPHSQSQPQQQSLTSFPSSFIRPPLSRPWHPTHFSNFQTHHLPSVSGPSTSAAGPPSPSSVPSTATNPSVTTPARGGTAIGVPALHPGSTPSNSFGSVFATSYSSVARNPVNAGEGVVNSSSATGRPAMHGMQSMGMMSTQMQHGLLPVNHQQRPLQSSYRPQTTSGINQTSPSSGFQGPAVLRPSTGSSNPPMTSHSQGPSTQNPPQMVHGSHARPPIPTPSRPQMNSQSVQQGPHAPLQSHHSQQQLPSPQQQLPSLQKQLPSPQQQLPLKPSNQQEPHTQQLPSPRAPPSLSNQQITRTQGSALQKPPSPAVPQPTPAQVVNNDTTPVAEIDDAGGRIVSKRSIQELVNQIDPSEKLDPEVEDMLIDIAEDFVESITTFACSLAKHRQSNTLEAKDILLHLERNWNMTLPGFSGDEIKTYKKPLTTDAHRERLTAVRKSMTGSETTNSKHTPGQASGNVKGHNMAKGGGPNASGP